MDSRATSVIPFPFQMLKNGLLPTGRSIVLFADVLNTKLIYAKSAFRIIQQSCCMNAQFHG